MSDLKSSKLTELSHKLAHLGLELMELLTTKDIKLIEEQEDEIRDAIVMNVLEFTNEMMILSSISDDIVNQKKKKKDLN